MVLPHGHASPAVSLDFPAGPRFSLNETFAACAAALLNAGEKSKERQIGENLTMKLDQCSREDLYKKVWSKPGVKLAAEFGVSDVAISKRCRRENIPRPPRGYWAKLKAGGAPKRPPLPPSRVKGSEAPAQRLRLPSPAALHALAAEFLAAAESARISYDKKRVHVQESSIPEAKISKEIALRAAKAFHVLLEVVEPRGIYFRKTRSSYEGGRFRKGNDFVFFKIEEKLVTKPGKAGQRSVYGPNDEVPCGLLTFTLRTERYVPSTERIWAETDKLPLERVLSEIAKFICDHYVKAQEAREAAKIAEAAWRVESERRRQEYFREQALLERKAAEERHAEALESVARNRVVDLLKAAEWWRLSQSVTGFIRECEERWLGAQGGELSLEQSDCLRWARLQADALSPFEVGYPDSGTDAGFIPEAVPFGGPYPPTRKFPLPPSMPKVPAMDLKPGQ